MLIVQSINSKFLKVLVFSVSWRACECSDVSYEYLILYVQNLDSSSPEAKTAATELVATALRLPTVFNFDDLFKLDAVLVIKDHVLFSLLQIFLNSGLGEFNSWLSSNHQVIEQYRMHFFSLFKPATHLLSQRSLAPSWRGRSDYWHSLPLLSNMLDSNSHMQKLPKPSRSLLPM